MLGTEEGLLDKEGNQIKLVLLRLTKITVFLIVHCLIKDIASQINTYGG